jgi:hypothetical protein
MVAAGGFAVTCSCLFKMSRSSTTVGNPLGGPWACRGACSDSSLQMQPIDSSLKAAPVAYATFNRSHFPLHPRSSPEGVAGATRTGKKSDVRRVWAVSAQNSGRDEKTVPRSNKKTIFKAIKDIKAIKASTAMPTSRGRGCRGRG